MFVGLVCVCVVGFDCVGLCVCVSVCFFYWEFCYNSVIVCPPAIKLIGSAMHEGQEFTQNRTEPAL